MAKFREVVSVVVRFAFLLAASSGYTPVSIEAAQADTLSTQQSTNLQRGWGVNVNLFGEVHAGDTVHTFLAELGVGLVRFDVNKQEVDGPHGWAHIDSTVAITRSEGAVPLAILTTLTSVDSATYRSFVRDAIERIGQDVDYFEIWNEPNLGDRPISPSVYDQLAAVAIDELHAAGEIAVGPALGSTTASVMRSYIEERLAANPGFDVVSFHSYGLISDTRERADAIDDVVGGRPLWLTEVGPADGTWDEPQSNSFLEGLIYEAQLMNVDQYVWWHLFSDGEQAPRLPESDLLEVTTGLVFQGKNASFYTFQGAESVAALAPAVAGAAPAALPGTVEPYRTVTEYWSQNTHYFNNSGGTPVEDFQMTVAQSFRLSTSPETGFSRIVECRRRNGKHRLFKRSSFSCPFRYNTPLTLGFAPTSSDASVGAARPLHEFRRRSNYYYTADPTKISAGIPGWTDRGVFAYVWF